MILKGNIISPPGTSTALLPSGLTTGLTTLVQTAFHSFVRNSRPRGPGLSPLMNLLGPPPRLAPQLNLAPRGLGMMSAVGDRLTPPRLPPRGTLTLLGSGMKSAAADRLTSTLPALLSPKAPTSRSTGPSFTNHIPSVSTEEFIGAGDAVG